MPLECSFAFYYEKSVFDFGKNKLSICFIKCINIMEVFILCNQLLEFGGLITKKLFEFGSELAS